MAMARPAVEPTIVAIVPTTNAIIVEVMTPSTMSPDGSRETTNARDEYPDGKRSGNLQPVAKDQTMIETKGTNKYKVKAKRTIGLNALFIVSYYFDESVSYMHTPRSR
jgi:hypothetical protein